MSIFFAVSLSFSLSRFFQRYSTTLFFLFEIRLFRDPPYLDITTSVLANDSLASCSISVSGRFVGRSRTSSCDRHRFSRQHFRRHVFQSCIFIPLNKQFLLPRRSYACLLYVPANPFPRLRKMRSREHRSYTLSLCFNVIREIYRTF